MDRQYYTYLEKQPEFGQLCTVSLFESATISIVGDAYMNMFYVLFFGIPCWSATKNPTQDFQMVCIADKTQKWRALKSE